MIVESLHIGNFRCILDSHIQCENLTALVGANGAGKSAVLNALGLFYAGTPRFNEEDFYAKDTTKDIEIEVRFADLCAEETALFAPYLEGGKLAVVRVLSLSGGKPSAKFFGSMLQNPDFTTVRSASSAIELRQRYANLRTSNPKYSTLPGAGSKDAALDALKAWELANAGECSRQRDDGQFFGFTQVAQGYLGKHTRFIFVPAVRDASEDAAEGKGTPITDLMDMVVRSVLASREDLVKLKDESQKRYDEIMDPSRLTEMQDLAADLTVTLKQFTPDACVLLSWEKGEEIAIPMPRTDVKLVEDGYPSTVHRTGHGLQRAFILTLLQHLAVAQPLEPAAEQERHGEEAATGTAGRSPNLILGIEEPELYQHPNRQRHLARTLLKLASGQIPGVAEKTQVIYCTHSPLFVGIDRFDQIRILRKVTNEDQKPKVTKCVQSTLDEVAELLWRTSGQPQIRYTGNSLRTRLHTIMTPWMNEGFFADAVVLVEGEEDRALLGAFAMTAEQDLESMGISIIPCLGKNNIGRAAAVFKMLGIPTYIIWDSDGDKPGADPEANRCLLRLLDHQEEDWPAIVSRSFASFRDNFQATVRAEVGGELFDGLMQRIQNEEGILIREQALKNVTVLRRVLQEAITQGRTSATLASILEHILEPRGGS